MKRSLFISKASAVALALVIAGCATWRDMDRPEKGTAIGATGGALAGAAIGGPVGAVIGAGAGGYAGHYEAQRGGIAANVGRADAGATNNTAALNTSRVDTTPYPEYPLVNDTSTVRAVQQALNERGFGAGPVDGLFGPNTERALRQFQHANGLSATGDLDQRTLSALSVSP